LGSSSASADIAEKKKNVGELPHIDSRPNRPPEQRQY
jgi:hypothetical protein